MELTLVQLAAAGAVATVLVQVLKWGSLWFGWTYSKLTKQIAAFVVSIILATVWLLPDLTVGGEDPVSFINSILQAATAVFAYGTAFYVVILDRVLEALNLSVAKLKAKNQ